MFSSVHFIHVDNFLFALLFVVCLLKDIKNHSNVNSTGHYLFCVYCRQWSEFVGRSVAECKIVLVGAILVQQELFAYVPE